MQLNQEVEVLRRVPLFAKLDAGALKGLAIACERLTFVAGEALFEQGDPCDGAYVIVEGRAEVCLKRGNRLDKVAEVGRYDLLGETAILNNGPRTASIVASEPVTALRIERALFMRILSSSPEIALGLMRTLASNTRRQSQALGQDAGPRLRVAEG